MRVPFSLFLAMKYLKPKRSIVSVITLLTMSGITFGVGVLIAVLAVMTGFGDVHEEHMIKLDSHIQVGTRGNYSFDPEPVMASLEELPEVRAVAPVVEGFVMMTRNGQAITGMMRGIDPEREQKIADMDGYLIDGSTDLSGETVLVGDRLAANLGTFVGDRLTIYSPQCFVSEDELRLPQEATVVGIFSVGMYDVDSSLMVASLDTARDVFAIEGGVQTLRVLIDNPYEVAKTAGKMEKMFAKTAESVGPKWLNQLRTETWMEIHRSLIGTLQVEKDMMFLLLCLISLVATMSVTNTLITLCVQKTHEIGLLKALGFSSRSIVGVFLFLGGVQGFFGCMLGVIFGVAVANNLDAILQGLRVFNPNLMPAEFYQFSVMPSRVTLHDVLSVCVIVMVFSILAGVLPAWRAARMEPVDALRHE